MSATESPEKKDAGESVKEKDDAKISRFILFIGNLSFSSTKEDLKEHFGKIGGLRDFRLMTKTSGESKGCGFLEFDNVLSQQKALKYHHTQFQGRKINVEATCGGGGAGEKRKEKIAKKKRKRRKPKTPKVNSSEIEKDGEGASENAEKSEKVVKKKRRRKRSIGGEGPNNNSEGPKNMDSKDPGEKTKSSETPDENTSRLKSKKKKSKKNLEGLKDAEGLPNTGCKDSDSHLDASIPLPADSSDVKKRNDGTQRSTEGVKGSKEPENMDSRGLSDDLEDSSKVQSKKKRKRKKQVTENGTFPSKGDVEGKSEPERKKKKSCGILA